MGGGVADCFEVAHGGVAVDEGAKGRGGWSHAPLHHLVEHLLRPLHVAAAACAIGQAADHRAVAHHIWSHALRSKGTNC